MITHDLGTFRTGYTAFCRIHGSLGQNIIRRIRIGEAGASQPYKAAPLCRQVGRPRIGKKLPQPAIAISHHGNIACCLLNLPGKVKETDHAFQRMLVRSRDPHTGNVKGTGDLGINIASRR